MGMMGRKSWGLGWVALTIALAYVPSATAQTTDYAEQAEQLAALRADLERLGADLETERELQRSRLHALQSQREELKLQLRQEETRLGALRRAQAEEKERLAAREQELTRMQPAVVAALDQLGAWVRSSLPFRLEERLADLDETRRRLVAGRLDPPAAASRLWQFVEDELSLCQQSGVFRQVIEIDGREQLVDVARLGMVALFYRTVDGAVGRAVPTAEGFRFEALADPKDARSVTALFDSMERGVRQGHFELPLPRAGLVGGAS